MKKILFVCMVVASCFGFDGYDLGSNQDVKISGNIKKGQDITIYNYNTGKTKDVYVDSVKRNPSGSVEIKTYDYQPKNEHQRNFYSW